LARRIPKAPPKRRRPARQDDAPDVEALVTDAVSRARPHHKPGHLPPTLLAEVTGRDADGEILAKPVEWTGEDEPPIIRLHLPRRARPDMIPGARDRVLLAVEEHRDGYSGRVIRVVGKTADRILGVVRVGRDGLARLHPVDKKSASKLMPIDRGDLGTARDGDLVAVEPTRGGRLGAPRARVVERMAALGTEAAISQIALLTHDIPHVFPERVVAEAEAARSVAKKGRADWTKLPLVTIDPADAKDHDDAVHAEPDPDPANRGGFLLTVAIADVAAYVRPGSALDREAETRGNSVYFPDRVVPMLPERLSNDLCSLKPGVTRPALAVRMVIGADGRKLRHTFHRILMRSAGKLAYPQAQAAIDGKPDDVTGLLLEPVLRPLWACYRAVAAARDQRGPLDLDLPERKVLLKPDGTVDRVIVPPRLDAHRLIEAFMIEANVAAAEELERARLPLIYRSHDAPSLEKLMGLREFLATFDITLPKAATLRPQNFNHILAKVRGTAEETLVNEVVLRSQSQAEYTAENYGHFGLNLARYAHFTSPIRRYADLIVHRGLVRAIGAGEDGLPQSTTRPQLAEIAARISAAERRAMAAERETIDRLIATHLEQRVGERFAGRVSGVTRAGLFVKLTDTGADGFVPAATIGNEFYRHDEARRALIGNRTGETYALGDDVEVVLAEVQAVAGAMRFELVSPGRSDTGPGLRVDARKGKPGRSGKPARRQPARKTGKRR
jgi:ribonuclease R